MSTAHPALIVEALEPAFTEAAAAWAARLGTFLFRRVSQDGGDSRFAERIAVAAG